LELTLDDKELPSANCLVDFDTGKVCPLPPELLLRRPHELALWAEKAGVDAVADLQLGGLNPLDMVTIGSADRFDSPACQEPEYLAGPQTSHSFLHFAPAGIRDGQPHALLSPESPRQPNNTHKFTTREGGRGLVEIQLENTAPPRLRVRYKMLRGASFPTPPLPASSSEAPHSLEGAPALAFTLCSADGEALTVSGGESELVVLRFWATWCGPCMRSLPQLQQLQAWAREHGKPLSIYTVNVKEKAPAVHRTCKQLGLRLPVLLDVDGRVAARYGSQGLPHTVVIRGATIRYVTSGAPLHLVEGLKHELAAAAPSDPDSDLSR
jgi:thiol-disulfide isomerase/thioredoxin